MSAAIEPSAVVVADANALEAAALGAKTSSLDVLYPPKPPPSDPGPTKPPAVDPPPPTPTPRPPVPQDPGLCPDMPPWFALTLSWIDRSWPEGPSRLAAFLKAHLSLFAAEPQRWERAEARWMRALLAIARDRAMGSPYALRVIDLADALQARAEAGEEVTLGEWTAAEAECATQADARAPRDGDAATALVADFSSSEEPVFIEPDPDHRAMARVAALTCEDNRCVEACDGLGDAHYTAVLEALFAALDAEAQQ